MGRHENVLGFSTIVKGDVDAALAAADVVVKGRYVTDPMQGVPIEPRAIVAQWQGDRVTIWSSTQVPYVARGGVAYTLGIPESHVRVIVPLLGGGFGAKCDFHFEAHVAALARAAGRPVKLVFSRHEEFFAVGHRREGMVIELETGARSDGTLARAARTARPRRRRVLRRGRLLRADGGDARARAVRARDGRRRVVARLLEQPAVVLDPRPDRAAGVLGARAAHGRARRRRSGSTRSSCAAARWSRRAPSRATGQVLERIAMKETLERAVELIGPADELPDDEAIGVACGWWPCFPAKAGAYVKLNDDGTGTIVTGAQENGTGAVMALPRYVAEELGMRPEDFSMLYQDTDAARGTTGSCGSQTTFNSARAVLAAAAEVREQLLDAASEELEAARDDLELVAGSVRVKGSPEKAVTIATLAAGGTFHGKGAGEVPESPPAAGRGLRRPARARVVPRAAADRARGARQGRPRDRCRARAPRGRRARLRTDPQPDPAPTARSTAAS